VFKKVIKYSIIFLFLSTSCLFAECIKPKMPTNEEWNKWINKISKESLDNGISQKTIELELSNLKPLEKIIMRDRCQPESTITFKEYIYYRLDKTRIYKGKIKRDEFIDELNLVSNRYNIQKEFILSIWGLESYYGQNQGKSKIIPALTTLSFDKRRSDFYKKQLLASLKLIDLKIVDSQNLVGSWAGAMGQVQFLPTTFFESAVDFNNDGNIDIWKTEEDVFASIANYLTSLEKAPWNKKESWGIEIIPPKNIKQIYDSLKKTNPKGCYAVKTMSIEKKLSDWSKLGFKKIDYSKFINQDINARLVAPDGLDGRMFLVFNNYKSILYYNCSHYYALSIGLLSDELKQ